MFARPLLLATLLVAVPLAASLGDDAADRTDLDASLRLADGLMALGLDGAPALDVLDHAMAVRHAQGVRDGAEWLPHLEVAQEKSRTARALDAIPDGSGVERALDAARVRLGPAADVATPEAPSEVVHALLDRYAVVATAEQEASIAALDDLPEPTRSALGRVVATFLAVDEAGRLLQAGAVDGASGPEGALSAADLARLDARRAAFLDAVDAFRLSAPAGHSNAVDVPFVVSMDLAGVPSAYGMDEPYALMIDVGGADVYENNGGGTAHDVGCSTGGLSPSTFHHAFYPAAALVDLGTDDDLHGRGDRCAVNGGGMLGVGMMFDEGGSDTYVGGVTNPGGSNGGAVLGGSGMLVDGDGDDAYTGGDGGANGGANVGHGLLIDGGGDDAYTGGQFGANGGSNLGGSGTLIDLGGNDTYHATISGVNGGGLLGSGFLYDGGGDDEYVSTQPEPIAFSDVSQGSGYNGNGFLYDADGDDAYKAVAEGNGAAELGGVGVLVDGAGNDEYLVLQGPGNGGALNAGLAFLVDGGGHDAYEVLDENPTFGTVGNGGASFGGVALLYDGGGDDRYTAREYAANGGAELASGFLLDVSGDDVYVAEGTVAVNGAGNLGTGLLYDGSGSDTFQDGRGTCVNPSPCTLVFGSVGVRYDG